MIAARPCRLNYVLKHPYSDPPALRDRDDAARSTEYVTHYNAVPPAVPPSSITEATLQSLMWLLIECFWTRCSRALMSAAHHNNSRRLPEMQNCRSGMSHDVFNNSTNHAGPRVGGVRRSASREVAGSENSKTTIATRIAQHWRKTRLAGLTQERQP